ncbi:MAG: TonB-dependent receptor, partial [Sphingomicrobium sp.]
CGAVYVDNEINDNVDGLIDPAQNNIVRVLRDLGQDMQAFDNGWKRDIYVTPGRDYKGKTTDGGVSLEVNYDFGGAKLTSISAYRGYKSEQNGDIDFGTVDILYRPDNGDSFRKFSTFSQELRLQGSAFHERLDWLVGGYFADEDLKLTDNLRFGEDYGRFATCRIITGGGLAGLYSPTSPLCVFPGVGPATISGASGASGPDIISAFNLLDTLNDRGSTQDVYKQNSRNWALFTHNIFHVTDKLDVTLGLRYTNERKKFDATFGNDNTACPAIQGLVLDDLLQPNQPGDTPAMLAQRATARALAGALIGLGCQGNSTAELNGVSIDDKRKEDEFTGTG